MIHHGVTRPCPKCSPAVALTAQRATARTGEVPVTVDVCSHCKGVWLDFGELQRLHALHAFILGITSNEAWQADLRGGACPSCGPDTGMRRIPVGAFAVDRCPECQGLWFDGGELGPSLTEAGYHALLEALQRARR